MTNTEVQNVNELRSKLANHTKGKRQLKVRIEEHSYSDKGSGVVYERSFIPEGSNIKYVMKGLYDDQFELNSERGEVRSGLLRALNTWDIETSLKGDTLTIKPRSYYSKESMIEDSFTPDGDFDEAAFQRQLTQL